MAMNDIGIGIVGCGGITLQNHLPGIQICPGVRLAALCDSDPATLQRALHQTGVRQGFANYEDLLRIEEVQAVIIATPNFTHPPIALAAVRQGKHVLVEKPLALNYADALEMARQAEAAGVRHMTAFTYRFVPAMRYLAHLMKRGDLGQVYHYRCCRLQDWDTRPLGWRQVRALAGTGELGDMLSHRIDFAHLLVGPISRVTASLKRFVDDRQGQPSDLDDWVAVLAEFSCGATGVLESSKLATGRGESWRSQDYAEINGSEGSVVFYTGKWNELQMGRKGRAGLETIPVPKEFWKWPGSPRDSSQGDPLVTFRYDQIWEFADAIRNQRPCVPSLFDGARVQGVMDAMVRSGQTRQWIEVPSDAVARGTQLE